MELFCALCIIRKNLDLFHFLRALRLSLLCRLQYLLCCLERRFCSRKTGIRFLLFVCPMFFQSCCLCGGVLLVEDGLSALCTFQSHTKILHRLCLRLFFCQTLLCRSELAQLLFCRCPRLARTARLSLAVLESFEFRGMAVNFRRQFGNTYAQFIACAQILRMQHSVNLCAFLVCRTLELDGLLKQSLLETLISFRAKDALHNRAAILDLGKQKPLKLSLRKKYNLTELIGVKSNELTDALRHLSHIGSEQNLIPTLPYIRKLIELTCR